MKKLVSKSEFALIAKVTRATITGLVNRGKLDIGSRAGKDLINLEGEKTKKYLSGKLQDKAQKTPEGVVNIDNVIDSIEDTPLSEKAQTVKTNTDTKEALQNRKLTAQAIMLEQKNEITRGEYIPTILVRKIFNKLNSIDANQIKTLGVTAVPDLTNCYQLDNQNKAKDILELIEGGNVERLDIIKVLNSGIENAEHKARIVLDEEVGKILVTIQRVFDDFLSSLKTEN